MSPLIELLKKHDACSPMLNWIQSNNIATVQEAWERCPCGSWLVCGAINMGLNNKLIALAVCDCARTVLQLVPTEVPKPLDASRVFQYTLETAEKYVHGEVDIDTAVGAVGSLYRCLSKTISSGSKNAVTAIIFAARSTYELPDAYEVCDLITNAFVDSTGSSPEAIQQKLADIVRERIPWKVVRDTINKNCV